MNQTAHDIKTLYHLDRPREKLIQNGVENLTDYELLAVLIGSGNGKRKVHQIAKDLLTLYSEKNNNITLKDLLTIQGMGETRTCRLLAATEFARRQLTPGQLKIQHPKDTLPLFLPYANKKQEHFITISLNGAYEVIKTRVVSIGLLNRTMVHPREVFADPLVDRAAAIIVGHNHPSGNLIPSNEDKEITRRLRKAGDLLGIELLDHIIVSSQGHYSFLSESKELF